MAAPIQSQNQIPKGPVRARLSNLWQKLKVRSEDKRSALSMESRGIGRRAAMGRIAQVLGIGLMVAVTPSLLRANPNEPAGKTDKAGIKYETISDAKELDPYFKNAKGKMVALKHNNWVKAGDYDLRVEDQGRGIEFSIKSADGKYEKWSFGFNAPMKEVNVLIIDVGENNPLVKGKMLVFADSANVYFQFFDKMQKAHSLAGVPLAAGQMRRGPIRTGFEIDADGCIDIVNAPKNLRSGDVVMMASLLTNGDSGATAFKFQPKVDTLAMNE